MRWHCATGVSFKFSSSELVHLRWFVKLFLSRINDEDDDNDDVGLPGDFQGPQTQWHLRYTSSGKWPYVVVVVVVALLIVVVVVVEVVGD